MSDDKKLKTVYKVYESVTGQTAVSSAFDKNEYIVCNSALGTLQGELKKANEKIAELESENKKLKSLFAVQLDMLEKINKICGE